MKVGLCLHWDGKLWFSNALESTRYVNELYISKGTIQCLDGTMISIKKDSIDYDTMPFLFNRLSKEEQADYLNRNKNIIKDTLIKYYDNYSTLTNEQTCSVLKECDFSLTANRELLLFYIHILHEILMNSTIDGYVGEQMIDVCYALFSNHPGCFYQLLAVCDAKTKENLMNNIVYGFYYNDINKNMIVFTFDKHKYELPSLRTQILLTEKFVEEHIDKI
jgi:hypothetical protein